MKIPTNPTGIEPGIRIASPEPVVHPHISIVYFRFHEIKVHLLLYTEILKVLKEYMIIIFQLQICIWFVSHVVWMGSNCKAEFVHTLLSTHILAYYLNKVGRTDSYRHFTLSRLQSIAIGGYFPIWVFRIRPCTIMRCYLPV